MTEQPPHDDTAETRRMTSGDPLGAGPPPPGDPPPTPPPASTGPPPAAERRLTRSRDDRVVAGVCAGIAAHLGVDAMLVRLAVIGLALLGGAGVLLYLAAIVLVPDASGGGAGATAPRSDRTRVLTIIGLVAVVLVAGPLLLVFGGLLAPFAFLAVLGILVAWLVTGRRPERDAGSLVRATLLGLGVLLLVGVLSIGAFWGAGVGGDEVVAGLVIAAGAALVAGAFLRPLRWLVLPALAVAISAGFVAAADLRLDGGIGERGFRPASAAEVAERYELGVGELVVDLRAAGLPAGDRRLDLRLGMGQVVLIVPEDVCVATEARVGMGEVRVFDRDNAGVDVAVAERAAAPAGTARILLDADVGVGELQVRHDDAPGRDDEPGGDDAGNRACGAPS